MTSIIDQLIQEREEEIRLAKEAKDAKRREASEALKASMKEFLGDFWKVLEERALRTGEKYICNWETNNDDIPIRIFYHIPALPELELAPIVIRWAGRPSSWPNETFTVSGRRQFSDLKDALRAAREDYPGYAEATREETSKEFHKSMTAANTEEEALATFAKYLGEYPDRVEEAQTTMENWKAREDRRVERQERERREQEERAAAAQLQRTLKIGYILDLAKYLKDYEETLEKNKETARNLQAAADHISYVAYKLTYAYIAEDEEDGETYREIETSSVWTLEEVPGAKGYWNINGRMIRYAHTVSVERVEVRASSGILAKSVERGGVELFFRPGVYEETIEALSSQISELPQAPEWPEGLYRTYGDEQDLRARAVKYNKTGEVDLDSYIDY